MRFVNVMIGSDPELFIVNNKTGLVVSSIGLIPGKKKEAYRPDGMPKGYGLQIDNILAEFNIPPVKNKEDFIHHINYMKDYIDNYVKEKNPDLGIKCCASQYVPWDQLESEEACLFGCDPDYNVYTEDVNPKPEGDKTNLRSAGTHIHVSYDNPNIKQSLALVKCMDLYLGLPSVFMDPDKDRRKLYGKAGSFRMCPYGVEYRPMSSFFISNDELIGFLFDSTKRAIAHVQLNLQLPNGDLVQKAINTGDEKLAGELYERYAIKIK